VNSTPRDSYGFAPSHQDAKAQVFFQIGALLVAKEANPVSPDENMVQTAYTSILESFIQTGRAPHYTELGNTLGMGPEQAKDLQREAAKAGLGACFLLDDTGYIESFGPFYNLANHYRVTVEGEQKWYAQ